MVTLAQVFNRLQSKRVLVAGDFMLDRYTFGKTRRISPEAPVPVVCVESEEERPGGAGNVILNLLSLGMQAVCFGRVGDDVAGESLIQKLAANHADTRYLIKEKGFLTPQKTRVIAQSQQVVRIDYETPRAMSESHETMLLEMLDEVVSDVHLVAISDYAKGFLTNRLLSGLIQAARYKGIPVISDPKGSDFRKYAGSTILKPNQSEAFSAAPNCPNLLDASQQIFKAVPIDVLMVTRSEAGISLFYPEGIQEDFPVEVREVKDVTGAGDTVLAMLACGLANNLSLQESTQLANIAAQVAVEKVGCACVTLTDVARRLIENHAHHKIFDVEHLAALKQALKGRTPKFLTIDGESELDAKLLRTIREAAHGSPHELVVAIQGSSPNEELVSTLASLKDVHYIFLTNQDPSQQFSW